MDQAERHAHSDRPRCVVVYESMFGNTEEIASAVADGLSARFDVEVCNVNDAASHLDRIDLLVVGAPTHAFGMSRRDTRCTAGQQRAPQAAAHGIGVREWLAGLQPADPATTAVAFDTRIRWVPGSAARAMRRRLRHLGYRTPIKAMRFSVVGTPGPLRAGELDRARAWGGRLAGDNLNEASTRL